MADISDAMKQVNIASTSKTQGGSGSAALNDTDLVQLYDNAGNPNGKITKSALMDAVKASLPALLADQTTTGVNFPSINGSGILGKMTAANLASVLGEKYYKGVIVNLENGIKNAINTSMENATNNSIFQGCTAAGQFECGWIGHKSSTKVDGYYPSTVFVFGGYNGFQFIGGYYRNGEWTFYKVLV